VTSCLFSVFTSGPPMCMKGFVSVSIFAVITRFWVNHNNQLCSGYDVKVCGDGTLVQILRSWTLSIVLSLFKMSCFSFETRRFRDRTPHRR
jgi:hypothetical protein